AYLNAHSNVRYVFVYALSRFARNRFDDAMMMMNLERLGVTLVSAMERNLDDTPAGRAMHGMLAVFNQYQVDGGAEDIQFKMGQKVMAHGGSIHKAAIGYENVQIEFDGRRINTVVVDEYRRGHVLDAFELYATGEYTETTLHEVLVERGFTMARTLKQAERPVSRATVAKMLRSRYYLGEVSYKGTWYKGRHEAIITEELFDRVQRILDSHSGAGVRSRKYNHYLKGTFWCDRCGHRLIFQPANGNGGLYYYFVCGQRLRKACDQPYVLADVLERALERYYVRVHLTDEFRHRVARAVDDTLSDSQAVEHRLKAQITRRLGELDRLEDRYVDQLGDPEWPQEKLTAKVAAIRRERAGLNTQLVQVEGGLEAGRDLVFQAIELLRRPQQLYCQLAKPERRVLTQAIFAKLMVDAREIVGHELREPFDALVAVQDQMVGCPPPAEAPDAPTPRSGALPALVGFDPLVDRGDGPARECWDDLTTVDLLALALRAPGSHRGSLVGKARFELATSRSRTVHSNLAELLPERPG